MSGPSVYYKVEHEVLGFAPHAAVNLNICIRRKRL
jgi:hypothetical protein